MSKRHSWAEWTAEEDSLLKVVWGGKSSLAGAMHLFPRHTLSALKQRTRALEFPARVKRGRNCVMPVWQRIEAFLTKEGAHSVDDVTHMLSMDKRCVKNAMYRAYGRGDVHVASYVRRSPFGNPSKVYAVGPGVDAPRPAPLTKAESWQRHRPRRALRRAMKTTPVTP